MTQQGTSIVSLVPQQQPNTTIILHQPITTEPSVFHQPFITLPQTLHHPTATRSAYIEHPHHVAHSINIKAGNFIRQ